MPDFPSAAWKDLIATPAPSSTRPGQDKSARRSNQKQVNQQMWRAIDHNDPEALGRALDLGAALTNRRKGATPLWQTVANGQWDLAEQLRARGADLRTRTQSGETLIDALARRDLVDEAEILKGWGVDPSQTTADSLVLGDGAPKLLLWWLDHGNLGAIPQPASQAGLRSSQDVEILNWALTAARGDDRLRAHLNKAWRLRAWDPEHFPYAFGIVNLVAAPLWTKIAHLDDVEMARRCLASGWGPPARTKENPNMFLWQAAHQGAWNLVAWFRQVPQFKKAMDDCARAEPGQWWRCATSVVALERLVGLGMDFQQTDGRGWTIAHHAVDRDPDKLAMVDWFIRHHPQMLTQADNQGSTPIMMARPAVAAHAQAVLLQGQASPATAWKTATRL